MELKLNATVELQPGDVQRIIEDTIKAQMQGYTVKRVEFQAGMAHDPFDRGVGQPVFKGVKVHLVPRGAEY